MPEPKLVMTAGALPYSDGSGDQFTATVERNDRGMMLRFDLIHEINVDDWSSIRETVDALVYSASRVGRKTESKTQCA